MRSIWLFLARLGSYIWFSIYGYEFISWIHRWLFDREYRNVPIATYSNLSELAAWMDKQIWTADDWDDFGDSVGSPNEVQAIGQDGDHHIGDCDEFAIYEVAAITASLAAGVMKEPIRNVFLMSVTWMKNWAPNGHNVCLIQWNDGTYSYMDYGMPNERKLTIPEVIKMVRERFASDSDGITACVQTLELVPVKIFWGK